MRVEHGNPLGVAISGGPTTYGALTIGLAIKPPVPKQIEGLVIKPEIRYDTSSNNTTPFGEGTKSSQWTFASDLINTIHDQMRLTDGDDRSEVSYSLETDGAGGAICRPLFWDGREGICTICNYSFSRTDSNDGDHASNRSR